jgi:hypothetical protein
MMHSVYNIKMVLSVLVNNLTHLWVYTYRLNKYIVKVKSLC